MPEFPWKVYIVEPVSHYYGLCKIFWNHWKLTALSPLLLITSILLTFFEDMTNYVLPWSFFLYFFFFRIPVISSFDMACSCSFCSSVFFFSPDDFPLNKCSNFTDIASKLGYRDVSDLTPTEIAIEVFLSLHPMFIFYFFPVI